MKYLEQILLELEAANIHFTLSREREGFVMITAIVPGERWEIEVASDGEIQAEGFKGNGEIFGREAVDRLLKVYSDAS